MEQGQSRAPGRAEQNATRAEGTTHDRALPDLQVHVDERLPEPVEVSAYYVIAGALANAAKNARASTVTVRARVTRDALLLSVRDDGAGGADFGRGTGLAGLKDRVEALGGRIFLDSPRGPEPAWPWNSLHRPQRRRHYRLAAGCRMPDTGTPRRGTE